MNRVHPTCTERPSLNKECGWKGDDRSGLAHGQELTGRKRRTKISLQEKKKRKNILDTHRPSHGRPEISCPLHAPASRRKLHLRGCRHSAARASDIPAALPAIAPG